jgi:hypothetical protein
MKKLLILSMVILIDFSCFAQIPQTMSYQCVVRNSNGVLVTNQSIGIRMSIMQGTTTGTMVYQETYNPNPQTNANGLLSLEIGGGLAITGTFSTIDWASGPYFLKTETDPTGGTNYTIVGTTQLLSVPYALYAKTSGNAFSGNYNNLTNKPTLFNGTWANITGKPTTLAGYGITDGMSNAHVANGITSAMIGNWNMAFSWGNHVGLYRPISYVPAWGEITGRPTSLAGYGITDAVNTTDNQIIGGIKTFTNDLSINGLTVGRGKGFISSNIALGNQALYSNTTGSSNTAMGTQSLFQNTTGYNNTGIGYTALYLNTSGYKNTASGYATLYFNTTGYNNSASGYAALYSNTTGHENTADGMDALGYNTTGSQNTGVGFQTLLSNTTGSSNTSNGYKALYSNTTGSFNTANGSQALFSNTWGTGNTANGTQTLYSNTTGGDNIAIGYGALLSNTTADDNTAIGCSALGWNTTGGQNTATGFYALSDNITGNRNTADGVDVLRSNTIGSDNTGNGWEVLFYSTGDRITAIGSQALYYSTTGSDNTANGYQALNSNTTGSFNTAVGSQALSNNSTGNNNTAIGNLARVLSPGMNNATAIGSGAIVNASNKVRIGNTDVSVIEGQVAFTSASDLRLKKNIKDLATGLEFITKLRPVEYQMRKGDDKINYGFIAQDIEKLVGTNNSLLTIGGDVDRILGLRYTDFIAPMVKAIQEQQVIIKEQQKEIDELKDLVKTLMRK